MKSFKNHFVKAIASSLYLGYSPKISGTVGSLWGVLIFYIFQGQNFPLYLYLTLFIVIISWPFSHWGEKAFNEKDASKITIDEVAGQLLTYLFIPYSFQNLVIGFVLFRVFDIIKIFPASWAQDKLPGGLGVAADDWIAGLQAAAVLYGIQFLY